MKINNLGYLFKEGIRGVFLHGFMSFAAVCVTVACLIIVGSFSILVYNINIMVDELNKTSEVLVYVDGELSDAEAKSVGTKINRIENVQQAVFVSREDALDNFIQDQGDDASFTGVDPQDLRHRFQVILMDNAKMEETVALIEQIPGVTNISAPYELAQGFTTLQNVLQIVSVAIIGVLLIVSLLLISNTVKLSMYDRKDEIAIMKMVGATNGFIELPFVVEGFLLGVLGAGVAFGLEWLLYDAVLLQISQVDTLQIIHLVPFTDLLVPMVATFSFAGLFVGVVGSLTSIRRFLNVEGVLLHEKA